MRKLKSLTNDTKWMRPSSKNFVIGCLFGLYLIDKESFVSLCFLVYKIPSPTT